MRNYESLLEGKSSGIVARALEDRNLVEAFCDINGAELQDSRVSTEEAPKTEPLYIFDDGYGGYTDCLGGYTIKGIKASLEENV